MERYIRATTITPHDTTRLTATPHDALFVALAASDATTVVDVTVQFVAGTSHTFRVPSGVILPFAVVRVMSTGTTANLIVKALRKG